MFSLFIYIFKTCHNISKIKEFPVLFTKSLKTVRNLNFLSSEIYVFWTPTHYSFSVVALIFEPHLKQFEVDSWGPVTFII